jgi:cytochrome c5
MSRASLAALLLLLGACSRTAAPADTAPAAPIALTSQTIALPDETATLPASAEILTTNCTACHSPEMLLTQPKLDAKTWTAEVAKMRSVYKAAIDPKDDPKLVAALLTLPNQK